MKMRLSEMLYARSVIDASPDPLIVVSADGNIADVNEATRDCSTFARRADSF